MPKPKIVIIFGAIVTLIILAISGSFIVKSLGGQKSATSQTTKSKIREEINVLPVPDRPVVDLAPTADGRSVVLTVAEMKKAAATMHYEIEYQAGTLLQGGEGDLDLTSLPTQKQILLGSCSAGGACTYHKDVQGGKLLTRFRGENNYTLKSDWRYIENKDKSTSFSSQDAKFTISSPELAKVGNTIIFTAPGYPSKLQSEPIADIYNFSSSGAIKGTLTVSIRLNNDQPAQLAYFDGAQWQYVAGTVTDKVLTATAPAAQIYTAIAP